MARKPRGERRRRPKKPNEAWSAGPLNMARFGKVVVMENTSTPEQHAARQKELAAKYPVVVSEIDRLVDEIATAVSELPAAALLQRAWWALAPRRLEVETESDVNLDDAVGMRMLDYVQSVIASVPRSGTQRTLEEADWIGLRANVQVLFQKLNHDFPICATAKAIAEEPTYDPALDEFRVKAQMYWCNVRGQRYQVHEPIYLREMFLPHSAVFEELFAITADQFVEQMAKLVRHLAQGIIGGGSDLEAFRKDVLDAIEAKLTDGEVDPDVDFQDLMAAVVSENGWQDRGRDVFGRTLGTDAFDLQKVTTLPRALLDALTWSEGAEPTFFAAGDMRGWPLRVWPVFRRPFVHVDGRYYCFDHYSLFDHLYRAMQRTIQTLKPAYKEEWNSIQARVSEELPFNYLTKLLPGSVVFRPVYYPIATPDGKTNWAEADGLLAFDDHLFVVEVKAGAFTAAPPTTDLPSYIKSLERLVQAPAAQGHRFICYLQSAEEVPVFNASHQEIGRVRQRDYRKTTICAVTLDSITELAAQVQHLRGIGVDVGTEPVWSVSVDDLRVYADVFENPLAFLHFVEQRMEAFRSDVLELEDELDHLGMYLEHNNYALHAKEMRGESKAKLSFGGYRDQIDRFFQARFLDSSTLCPLRQKTPHRIMETIDKLATSQIAGRSRIASLLLDGGGEWRARIAASIDNELRQHPTTRRPLPLSLHGSTALTIYCWSPIVPRNAKIALEHTRSVLLLGNEAERVLLELSYDADGSLGGVDWTLVTRSNIPASDLPQLMKDAEDLRKARLNRAAANSKVGRNEPCPCGSGKKFKKCCIS